MRFSDDFLTELRANNDITDVVSSYVTLSGAGRYTKGLCPFHNERTPSFVVYSDTQSYYCFGCGSGGDVVTFIKNIEGLDYADAVRFLANRCNMQMPLEGFDDTTSRMRRRLAEANREAARFFYRTLCSEKGKKGLDYFRARGLTDATIAHFGLGYAPDGWTELIRYMKGKGYSENELVSADLARRSSKGNVIDAFRNRVMFPIIDLQGTVIAFGGRVLDDSKPKYLNTSDTLIYKKSKGVFALNLARKTASGTLILCEGYMDVIAYHQAGFTNAVAGLGTAFTREQAKLLSKYCEEVILSYDADEAGQKAAKRAIDIFAETEVRVKVARLTGGKDSDEIIRKYGPEKMKQILDDAVSATEYKLDSARKGYSMEERDDKAAYLSRAAEIIADIREPVRRDIYASSLARDLGVSKEAILQEVKLKARRKNSRQNAELLSKAGDFGSSAFRKLNPARRQNLRTSISEENLLAMLITNPDFYRKLRGKVEAEDFSVETNRHIFEVAAARLDEERPADLTHLGEDLESEEIGYISGLLSTRQGLKDSVEECLDCVANMKKERRLREAKAPAETTDEEFLALFKKLKGNNQD